jgi:hypothetical protein
LRSKLLQDPLIPAAFALTTIDARFCREVLSGSGRQVFMRAEAAQAVALAAAQTIEMSYQRTGALELPMVILRNR